ncbi:VPS10, VPS10 domain protein [Bacillus wiedmannii]|uniref:F510_1955 family glycosylhydrolase n=1 Tax=Bacillus wiedmannii TaxID=1890302 RepID=UPI000BECDFF2|nr:VPS10, VPS10 domain protein [Bacillus wiedmannii]PEG10643.1 VPS10, VPS10 domain protein [Bacillus wiedmannii]PEJ55129.1 VPS10, VPS10 domain protein [Bacillus wiedmannii]PEL41812.1 VPS10, VPS10 domain protein [Bacillus wiedmannii]PEO92291.1 VPS10, VPS10 domain protein [Bacillus wiedmannii]PGA32912.1 VPS10, VPS10 domain protein [Bacillus wiedmannii]
MKYYVATGIAITSLFIITGCSSNAESAPVKKDTVQSQRKHTETVNTSPQNFYKETTSGKIEHIHGIGYAGNMPGVSIATHSGIKVYQNGKWFETKTELHDYMGFQATKNGFFASGHPEPDANLKNPLGLMKSSDGGNTLEKLAFYGESDFHNLAVGYNTEAIYLYNERPNSKLQQGFYFSTNNGQDWKESKLKGLSSTIHSFSVHPDQSSVVAVSAKDGVYLSTDYGNTFELFSTSLESTAVTLSHEDAFYAPINKQMITKKSIATNEETNLQIPSLDSKDTIMYISQNPQNSSEIVFATMKANVFLSIDEGKTWKQITKEGTFQFN